MTYLKNQIASGLGNGIRRIAFWIAVLMPILYIPLLLVGFKQGYDFGILIRLFAINTGLLIVGHNHKLLD